MLFTLTILPMQKISKICPIIPVTDRFIANIDHTWRWLGIMTCCLSDTSSSSRFLSTSVTILKLSFASGAGTETVACSELEDTESALAAVVLDGSAGAMLFVDFGFHSLLGAPETTF
jgi:hypothetical protein